MAKNEKNTTSAATSAPMQGSKEAAAAAAAAAALALTLTEQEVADLSEDHTHCLVCYGDLKVRGKTPCEHDDICGVCHLRLRHLHDDHKCPICKTSNDQIIVDDTSNDNSNDNNNTTPISLSKQKRFSEYPMWGEEIGSGYVYRQDVGMFFSTSYYEQEILPLFGYQCHVPACTYDPAVAILAAPVDAVASNNNNSNSGATRATTKNHPLLFAPSKIIYE
jgi:hypothetical protein